MSHRHFAGRRIFITGGSAGIGLETARQAVSAGAHVCIAARGRARLEEALTALEASRREPDQKVSAVVMDVGDPDTVTAGAGEALRRLGGLDLLINNAGYALTGYARDYDEAAMDEMLDVNYRGMVRVLQAFLPHLMEQRGGHIVNVSSILGFLGIYGFTAYSASKFAIAGYTHCLRQELLEYGVRVSLFYPPTTDTPGLARENLDKPPESWAVEGESNRIARPEEVARALLRGIRRGRYEIHGSGEGAFIHWMNRVSPTLVRRVMDRPLKRYQAKRAAPVPGAGARVET